jgi:hypothetical protein
LPIVMDRTNHPLRRRRMPKSCQKKRRGQRCSPPWWPQRKSRWPVHQQVLSMTNCRSIIGVRERGAPLNRAINCKLAASPSARIAPLIRERTVSIARTPCQAAAWPDAAAENLLARAPRFVAYQDRSATLRLGRNCGFEGPRRVRSGVARG